MNRLHQRHICWRRWLKPAVGQLTFVLLILPAHSVRFHAAELLTHPATGFEMRKVPATTLQMAGANLQIDFLGVEPDLPRTCIITERPTMEGFLFRRLAYWSSWQPENMESCTELRGEGKTVILR